MSKYKNNFLKWLYMLGTGGLAGFFDRDDSDPNDLNTWQEVAQSFKSSDLGKKWTGSGLTGAELEANQFNAEQAQIQRDFEERMSNTSFQRQVADMKSAGVNPAIAMRSGSSGAVVPSGSAATSVSPGSVPFSLSDLMQVAMLPLQMKKMKADIRQTEVKTSGEELKNQYQNMVNSYYPSMQDATISKIYADIAGVNSTIEVQAVQKRLYIADALLREAEAKYADEFAQKKKAYLDAQTDTERANAAAAYARAAMDRIESAYMRKNNMRMGTNSLVALATAITGWLNPGDDGTVLDAVTEEVKEFGEKHEMTNEDGSFITLDDIKEDRKQQRAELKENIKSRYQSVQNSPRVRRASARWNIWKATRFH